MGHCCAGTPLCLDWYNAESLVLLFVDKNDTEAALKNFLTQNK